MTDNPAISFVIPVYNAEKYLGQAIESLLRQSVPDWEMLIVDDCSIDSSPSIAREYAERDKRIRLLQTETRSGGAITPRTLGIRNARAEIVAPLDADDFVNPGYLENLLDRRKESGAELVFPTMYGSDTDYHLPITEVNQEFYAGAVPGREAVKSALQGWHIHCNGGLIPKKLYLEAFGEMDAGDRHPMADELLTRRLLFKARSVAMSREKYYYRKHPAQKEKHNGKNSFTHLINHQRLVAFARDNFGPGSHEHELALTDARYGILNALRTLGSPGFNAGEREYCKHLISQVRNEMEPAKADKMFPGKYRVLLSLPPDLAAKILRIAERNRPALNRLRNTYRRLRAGTRDAVKEIRLLADTLRVSLGGESRNELDMELDGRLYSGQRADKPTSGEIKEGVICILDGNMTHGGLTDRLRGILSAFSEAEKKGRRFYIMWDTPFDLSDYLEPAGEDWRMERSELIRDRGVSRMVTVDDMRRWQSRLRLKGALRSRKLQIHLYTNADSGIGEYARLYRELFRPAERLRRETERHLAELGEGYRSVSFRFMGHLGDFNDCDPLRLSPEDQEALIGKALKGLDSILEELPPGRRLLVTSDSTRFIERAAAHDPRVYVVEGEIRHVDLDRDRKNDVWLKTFLDQQLIMGAERVYRMLNPLTYKSGFPRFAAEIGGKPLEDREF